MKYGPDLPRDTRFIARVGRAFQVIGLGAVGAFLFSVALSLYMILPLANLTPQELYHEAWAQAQAHSYDPNAFKDWDKWEHKFDNEIKTQQDAIDRVNELLKATGDHYAVFLDPTQAVHERNQMQGQFAGIGVELTPKIDDKGEVVFGSDKTKGPLMATDVDGFPTPGIISGGPAAQAGVLDGDAVVAIDGKSMKNATMEDFYKAARGQSGSSITLTIKRGGKQFDLPFSRGIVKTKSVSSKMLTAPNGKRIGYIRLDSFIQQDTPQQMKAALESLKDSDKLILDLRFNPGGDVQVCVQLMSMFIEKGVLVSLRERQAGAGHIVQTYAVDGNKVTLNSKLEGTNEEDNRAFPRPPALGLGKDIVILVNGQSASAAEMFTGALKDHNRAVVVGERTFGKGIGQVVMPMANGTVMHVTSLRYFTPNGTWLGDGGNGKEQFGVEPHHTVKFDENPKAKLGDIARDNQLFFAVDLLSK